MQGFRESGLYGSGPLQGGRGDATISQSVRGAAAHHSGGDAIVRLNGFSTKCLSLRDISPYNLPTPSLHWKEGSGASHGEAVPRYNSVLRLYTYYSCERSRE